jgi:hypothetical protein
MGIEKVGTEKGTLYFIYKVECRFCDSLLFAIRWMT